MNFSLLPALCAALCLTAACSGPPPEPPRVIDGRLIPCPDSPNCVSTNHPKTDRRIEPLPLEGGMAAGLEQLARAIEGQPGCRVVEMEPPYLHAECASKIFGFVDDVEALARPEAGVIELRSGARLGWWDLGVNKRRMERLRQAYLKETRP